MKQELGLKILDHIFEWEDDHARDEFAWLKLMSRLKYDGYRDFLAGARFVESLATWLQQFKPEDREAAYDFVKRRLVYVGYLEMQRLVESFYPEVVQPLLISDVAKEMEMPPYLIWSNPNSVDNLKLLRRKTLFLGLSDGAKTDILRRSNVGVLSNEQIVVTSQPEESKWRSLLSDLRQDVEDDVGFNRIYLLDDFVASGTTLLRFDNEQNEWTGKLPKFLKSLSIQRKNLLPKAILVDNWRLNVHHHLATKHAVDVLKNRYSEFARAHERDDWFNNVEFTYRHVLSESVALNRNNDEPFQSIVEQYYNPIVEEPRRRHLDASGIDSLKYGYAECGLSLILEHNTPNNSLALLWVESENAEQQGHFMRPLFRRRDRHL